jgi:8-oxo-dGTP pyrophosphatase MutT (NUDIX family)
LGPGEVKKGVPDETGPAPELAALRSAGGVVVSGEGDDFRVAVMRSTYSTWVLPKGRIEQGETSEDAARREIGEEIGLLQIETVAHLGWTEHRFERDGVRLRKRVDWFLFTAPKGSPVSARPDQNVLDCGWFTPQRALSMLSHPNQRRMLRRALARWSEQAAGTAS